MADETDRTHFGFESVPRAEKQERVNDVFHTVARRYDLMNDLMSARAAPGLEGCARHEPEAAAAPAASAHLDVAGGTGDVAFRVLDAGGPMTHVTVARHQRRHARGRARAGGPRATRAGSTSSRRTPRRCRSPTRSFDGYSIAFGIRNVPRIEAALAEAHRVLRPGGAIPLPRVLARRRARPRRALRRLFLQRHPAPRPAWSPAMPTPTAISSSRSAASQARRRSGA